MSLDKKDFIVGVLDKYPEELLKNRMNIESCIIGCIWKDCLLIDDSNLTAKDFVTVDGRYYYSLASHLRKIGLNVLDEVGVTANITEEMSGAWEERGGWNTIENVVDVIDLNNYTKYLEDLYKGNVILGLHRDGFNLMTEIEEKGKKYRPIDLFQKLTSEQIIDWYESRLASAGTGYSSRVLEEEEIDFDDEFLADCTDGNNEGTHFDYAGVDLVEGKPVSCYPFLSRQISGFGIGSHCIAAHSGCGKSSIIIGILMALMNNGRKVLVISNEEQVSRYKVKFLTWVLYKYFRYYGVTRKKILTGDLSEEDKKIMKKAQAFWRENFKGKIRFVGIPDSDMSIVKKKSREAVLKYGYDVVFYDTMKYSFDDNQSKEYLSLIRDSRDLDEMARKYNITVIYSLQLSLASLSRLWLDASCLSMCKAIKEVLESLILFRNLVPEELNEKSRYYISPFRLKQTESGKWIEEPYEVDKTDVYKILYVDKARNGTESSSTGVCYLMKFDGAHSVFTEVAQCRPSHGQIM